LYAIWIPREILLKIWRRSDQNPYSKDLKFALLSFIIAFPLVIFLNEFLDFLTSILFHAVLLPDQIAVRFLKMTFQYPRYFFMSVIIIVILAPLLEEILFRGFLQSFIRKHLGVKSAIYITALCFSLFHYSLAQGLANISIVGSLFSLALFLGFVYERRGSLITSMTLHATFNAANVLSLYFLEYFPKAL
jgi:membrane protease YdiL (CAAX protease family)